GCNRGTDLTATIGGSTNCASFSPAVLNLVLPGDPTRGIPDQPFTLTFAATPPTPGGTCSPYSPATAGPCSGCPPFNNTDTPTGPGGVGGVGTACCPIDLIPKFLNVAIANVSCNGCVDGILGALVYSPALGAWTGNFIVC